MTDYITRTELYQSTPDVDWSADYADMLGALITRASRAVDLACKRPDNFFAVETATARLFDGSGGREQWVDHMAAAPTLVEVDESGDLTYTTWASSDYMVWPYNAAAVGKPYQRLDIDQLNGTKSLWYRFPRSVRITAKWGYSTAAPGPIKQATIIQVMRWFKRGQQAYQDTGAIFDLGQLQYVKQTDPDIVNLLLTEYMAVPV